MRVTLGSFALLLALAAPARAEVELVEMKIAGYLCGY